MDPGPGAGTRGGRDWTRAAGGRRGGMGRRRRRADGAAGLPEAIAALSRVLPDGPSPETFRRAKFDRPEAAPALWRLLVRVLCPPPTASPEPALDPEAEARLVKSTLRGEGYPRWALARLPEDGAQGSRELLLALAWLLARGPLLQQLLTHDRVRLGDEMPLCQCEALASPGSPAPHAEADGPVDVRHLQWLMGKLRFRRRALAASQQEQCALLSKIHSYTRGCHGDRSLGHLSVVETELLRDPEAGRQLLRRLESENERLEAFLQWRSRELVFWQWMVRKPGMPLLFLGGRWQPGPGFSLQDSVLDAGTPEASEPTLLPGLPQRGAGQLDLLSRELQALQAELQEAALLRRVAWEAGAGAGAPEQRASRRAMQKAVACKLAALRQAWGHGGALGLPHGPCRLVRDSAVAAGGLQAAQAIGVLRSRVASLEAELQQLQGRCRQELARLAGAQPGLLWIPPPGRRGPRHGPPRSVSRGAALRPRAFLGPVREVSSLSSADCGLLSCLALRSAQLRSADAHVRSEI
ncbi:Tubulin epsilon and delta complex protein 1 [Galemys pyrenaicus]|uniref:Tubulin epsilon and delta complex protein 1 n=1 Tax=Galemys pyrenaicus TaxID=202257 RepID=A0A8J6ABZ8_GALPY|nr:Tubulin epsilon and delta complex protein 1 [Galemys pyrenaicus]